MTSILSGRKKKKLMARRMGQMRPEIFCQVRTCLIHSLHLAFFLCAAYILYGKNRVWWTYITLGSDWYRVAPVECVAKMGKYIMTFLLSLSRLRFLTATVLKPQLSALRISCTSHFSPHLLRKRKEENEIISPVLLVVVVVEVAGTFLQLPFVSLPVVVDFFRFLPMGVFTYVNHSESDDGVCTYCLSESGGRCRPPPHHCSTFSYITPIIVALYSISSITCLLD